MYKPQKFEMTPQNFFAGEFPTLTDTGTAAAALAAHTPVMLDTDGNVAVATAAGIAGVIGITADAAEAGAPVVYYQTGEFFENAIVLPTGITVDALKPVLRKLSIFLR